MCLGSTSIDCTWDEQLVRLLILEFDLNYGMLFVSVCRVCLRVSTCFRVRVCLCVCVCKQTSDTGTEGQWMFNYPEVITLTLTASTSFLAIGEWIASSGVTVITLLLSSLAKQVNIWCHMKWFETDFNGIKYRPVSIKSLDQFSAYPTEVSFVNQVFLI